MPHIIMLNPVICAVERSYDNILEVIIQPEKKGQDISVDTFILSKSGFLDDSNGEDFGVIHFDTTFSWSFTGGGLSNYELRYIADFILAYEEPEVDF